mmetsp:Transcript_27679/g.32525  ORF Transcript_27679/g.32525 Transcript_27679/m.32525 type:complete len:124 (-) Transcript_27679:316-687(-)
MLAQLLLQDQDQPLPEVRDRAATPDAGARHPVLEYMIEMNRISRLLHKASFIVRQRRAIDYSHRFIITDANLRAEQAKQAAGKADSDLRTQELLDPAFVDKLLENFDPGSDLQDRRILYEVTE